jgi:hypothetical protein
VTRQTEISTYRAIFFIFDSSAGWASWRVGAA